jgi:hypothetical protein
MARGGAGLGVPKPRKCLVGPLLGLISGPNLGVPSRLIGGMNNNHNNNDNNAFRNLTSEWDRLCRGRRAREAFAEWQLAEPLLGAVPSLADLLGYRQDHEDEIANEILAALLRIGDELACRAFVQAVLPALVGLTRTGLARGYVGPGRTWREPAELNAELLARTWMWVGRMRGNPPPFAAGALKDHLLSALRREAARNDLEAVRLVPFEPTSHDRHGDVGAEPGGIDGAMKLLCEAVEAGLIPLGYAQVLFSARIRRDPYRVISRQTGKSVEALKQQCRRAERTLARAVAA